MDLRIQLIDKYMTGASEHGGDIGEVSLLAILTQIEQEAFDTIWYIRELKRRLENEEKGKT